MPGAGPAARLAAAGLRLIGRGGDARALLLGTGAGVMLRGVEVVAKLGLYLLAGRRLGLHDAGVFFLCLNLAHFGGVVGRLGVDRALTRFLAAELAVDRPAAARRLLHGGLAMVAGATVLLAAGAAIAAAPIAAALFHDAALAGAFRLAALVMIGITAAQMAAAVLSGLKRPALAQLVANALWPSLACLAFLLPIALEGALLAVAGAYLLAAAIGFAAIAARDGALAGRPDVGAPDPEPVWQAALSLLVVEVVQASLLTFPTVALGLFATPEAVGAFSLANRISLMVWMVLLSVWSIAGPVFSEHHRLGDLPGLARAAGVAQALGAALGVPLALVMMLLPGALLGIVGPQFRLGATALAILGLGQLVNALLSAQDLMLAMTGHNRAIRWLNLGQLVACVGGSLLLIPPLGLVGAALAAAVATAGGAIAAAALVPRLAGLPGLPLLRLATGGGWGNG